MPELLPASSHRAVPWRNGGGTTDEIAVQPDPLDPTRFAWRISIATVAAEGPFSVFPGIDRTLLLVDGSGMLLRVDGGSWRRVTRPFEPIRFAGEASADCRLIAGPIHDLNVMVDRRSWRADVRVLRGEGTGTTVREASVRFLIAFHGSVRLECGGSAIELAHRDGLRLAEGEDFTVRGLDAGATLVGIMLIRVHDGSF